MSSAASNPRPQQPPQQKIIQTKYDCGGCGEEVLLKPREKVECPNCNYPVYFKKRTRRIVEFQAR